MRPYLIRTIHQYYSKLNDFKKVITDIVGTISKQCLYISLWIAKDYNDKYIKQS